jgi:hypothetical protein
MTHRISAQKSKRERPLSSSFEDMFGYKVSCVECKEKILTVMRECGVGENIDSNEGMWGLV